jgi:hypothetical protein
MKALLKVAAFMAGHGNKPAPKHVLNLEDLKNARGAHYNARHGAAWARGEFNSDVFSNPSDVAKHISDKGRKKGMVTQAVKGPLPTMSHMAKTVAEKVPSGASKSKALTAVSKPPLPSSSDTAKTVAENKITAATAKTKAISDTAKTVGARSTISPNKTQSPHAAEDRGKSIMSATHGAIGRVGTKTKIGAGLAAATVGGVLMARRQRKKDREDE